MNAYKEWIEGNITDSEYTSLCLQEKFEYFEYLRAINSDDDDEEVLEEDDIDEF